MFIYAIRLLKTVFEILLAEDNPGDVLLFREALNSRELPCNVVVAAGRSKSDGSARRRNRRRRRRHGQLAGPSGDPT